MRQERSRSRSKFPRVRISAVRDRYNTFCHLLKVGRSKLAIFTISPTRLFVALRFISWAHIFFAPSPMATKALSLCFINLSNNFYVPKVYSIILSLKQCLRGILLLNYYITLGFYFSKHFHPWLILRKKKIVPPNIQYT